MRIHWNPLPQFRNGCLQLSRPGIATRKSSAEPSIAIRACRSSYSPSACAVEQPRTTCGSGRSKKTAMSTQANKLAHSYLDAKQEVIAAGFAQEIDWQEDIRFSDLTEATFVREYTWVVFSSGFREAILRRKFDDLATAFRGL